MKWIGSTWVQCIGPTAGAVCSTYLGAICPAAGAVCSAYLGAICPAADAVCSLLVRPTGVKWVQWGGPTVGAITYRAYWCI